MIEVWLKNKAGLVDVTHMVGDVTWSGSESEVARKLEVNFLYALHDHYAPKVYPNIGEELYLYYEGKELFRGKVFYNERFNEQGIIQITCFDDAIRLAKSKGTYNFKGKTAEEITQRVCNDLGIETGTLAQTGIPQKMLYQSMNMYQIIKKGYEGAACQNQKKYSVEMREGKLYVDEVGKEVISESISVDTNILQSSYSQNAENVINRVKIYDDNDQYLGMVEDNEGVEQLGVFQDVYTREKDKQARTVANNMLKGIEERIEITTLGNVDYRTGRIVKVQDSTTKTEGLCCITDDSHKWNTQVE